MGGADWRQQQELQEFIEQDILSLLTRVEMHCGRETSLAIAAHLGYLKEWLRHSEQQRRVA